MIERIRNRFRENAVINALSIPVIIYGAVLIVRIIMAMIQTADYANEYRESANVAMTRAILNGVNPYALSTLDESVPSVCYLYGPLMSVIAASLAIILPFLSLQMIHYIISLMCIIISGILVAIMISEHTRTYMAASVGFVLTVFCHWRYGYVYAAPDSFGLLLLITVLFILTRESFKFRPELSALFVVMTLFSKQYFLMVALTGAVYLFIISKKEFIRYVVAGVVISAIVFTVLGITCPLYFTYAIYFLKGPGAGAAMGKTGIAHNNLQVSYLGGMLLTLFITVFLAGVKLIYDFAKKKISLKDSYFKFILLFWLQMLFSGIVLRYIGNNAGAFLSYYLQLFVPGLLIVAVCTLDNFNSDAVFKKRVNPVLVLAACYIIFCGYTIYKVEPRLIINKLNQEEMDNWGRAYEIMDEHLDGMIYYMPPVAYHGYSNDKFVYNDGQPFVIGEKFLKEFNTKPLYQKLFPNAGKIMQQHLSYRESIVESVRKGEYSLLTTVNDMDTVFTEDDMKQHYKLLETIPLRTGNWAYEVNFYVLK